MKSIEFNKKIVSENFLTLSYFIEEKDMVLVLNIPDLIDYLYKTDMIDEWDEGDSLSTSLVMWDEVQYPSSPDEDQKYYSQKARLDHFIGLMSDCDFLRIITYHEKLKDNDVESIFNIMDNIKNICDKNKNMMQK